MEIKVYFPGGQKVYADFKGFTHKTDQPESSGGEGSAPTPFDLFLASIGTCAGVYVNGFCRNRGIDTSNIELIQGLEFGPDNKMVKKINLEIKLPPDFPEKYRDALVHVASLCTVKKHMETPPEFNITTTG